MERKSQKGYGKPPTECVSNKAYGYGRAIDDAGDWKYQKHSHVVGIFGVAWKHDNSSNHSENVDLMNPDNYWKGCQEVMPNTYVLLVWKIDGKRLKSWETRTVVRRLWGNNAEADNDIYKAARVQEKRRGELEGGIRKAESRTPPVALDRATTPPRRTTPARRNPRASPASEKRSLRSASKSKQQKPAKDLSEILAELRVEFLEFFGVDSVAELEPEEQQILKDEPHVRRAAAAA